MQAVIHLESIQPSPKRVDYLDSLVEKFIMPNTDNSNMASTADREEISSIFLEVTVQSVTLTKKLVFTCLS